MINTTAALAVLLFQEPSILTTSASCVLGNSGPKDCVLTSMFDGSRYAITLAWLTPRAELIIAGTDAEGGGVEIERAEFNNALMTINGRCYWIQRTMECRVTDTNTGRATVISATALDTTR
jgi:hypothetical protein